MASMGGFNLSELKKLQKNLNKLEESQVNEFIEACAKELTARLLAKVVKNTPVGDYSKEIQVTAKRDSKHHKKGDTYTKRVNHPSGKKGGTLRRGWTSKSHEEAASSKGKKTLSMEESLQYVNSLTIHHLGDAYKIELINPVEYASYVEYGHRTANHKGWVQGKLMMTISEQEINKIAPKVLENKIKKFLGGAFQ